MTATTYSISLGQYSVDRQIDGIGIPPYDYVSLTNYSGTNPQTITYKVGGASGTTVATLTLTYDGSGNLTSITKG